MVREREANVVLIDVGNVFGNDAGNQQVRLKARVALSAMGIMGYDALNVSGGDLSFGQDFLTEWQSAAGVPFLSANLIDARLGKTFNTSYIVKDLGQLKVALVGVTSASNNGGSEWYVQDVAAALNSLVPEIRTKADLIVVLADMTFSHAARLIHDVKQLSVVLTTAGSGSSTKPVVINNTVLSDCGQWGMSIDQLKITANTDGRILGYTWTRDSLDETIPDNPDMVELMAQHGIR